MDFSAVEIVGYLASALIVASLAMTSVVRLRTISLTGSIVFVIYGALIGSIPIIITNASIAGLNIWFLRKEFSPHRDLGAVPSEPRAPYLLDFLSSHREDIKEFHPGFTDTEPEDFALILTRDGLPAGAFVARRDGTSLQLKLDYVMNAYRDSRIGQWLYQHGTKPMLDAGFDQVIAQPESEELRQYLVRVGFTESDAGLVRQLRG